MGNFIGVGSEITVSTPLERRWKPFTSLAVASDDGRTILETSSSKQNSSNVLKRICVIVPEYFLLSLC